jgi:putative oxidoreductase
LGLALYLPWLELLCAAAVLTRRYERGALLLLAGWGGIFTVALASAWLRGLDISCGCFGHSASPTALPWAIARSLTLGMIALGLLQKAKNQRCSGGNPP